MANEKRRLPFVQLDVFTSVPLEGNQLAVTNYIDDAQAVVAIDYFILEPKIADELQRPRLGCQETIGTGFENTAVAGFRLDHAAQARASFDQSGANAGFV